MLLQMSKEKQEESQKLWKLQKKTLPLQWRFSTSLKQSAESLASLKEKLKKSNLDTHAKKSALAEPEDSETQPALPTDLTPLEEDFVVVTYRALTAAVIEDRALDFSDEKMLKRGVPLLKGQTVYKDHETSVDNWVGTVQSTTWDSATEGLPPGINAELRLDAVKDPMAIRGVLQGAIHSASVTVEFLWEPSHPDLMTNGHFWEYLGNEYEGQPVRIIVTEIQRFLEISLVWQGADQYAKQISQDGTPLNTFSLQLGEQKFEENKMKIFEKLSKLLGGAVNEDNIEQSIDAFAESRAKDRESAASSGMADLQKNLEKVSAELAEIKKMQEANLQKIKDLTPQAELGSKYLADERAEAERLCKFAKGEKVSEAILQTLREGSLGVVQAWKEEFQKECDQKYPHKCASCGGKSISRQSSKNLSESEDKAPAGISPDTAKRVNNLHR